MELKAISFTNEKGNVSVETRNKVRKMVDGKIFKALADTDGLETITLNGAGGFSIPVAKDIRTGETVYVNIATTYSCTPTEKKAKSTKKKTAKAEVVVPDLFGNDETDED
jgi:hypothetical protein